MTTKGGRIKSGQDSRRLLPQAVVSALTALIDDQTEKGPSPITVELRVARSRLCRVFHLEDPQGYANESQLAQELAEEDGDGVPDTV